MKAKYPVQLLCSLMGITRSGYYKWRSRQGRSNRYQKDRQLLTELLLEQHQRFPSYGYHRLASVIRLQTGWLFSDNLAHKCCKQTGIRSKARRYTYRKPGAEHIIYPNTVKGNWNATKPLELVVSDMTCLWHKGKIHEWVYMLDTFNNEIISHHPASRLGDTKPYFLCLEDLKQKMDERTAPTVLHTDQGSVCSSRAFAKAHEQYTIFRSMSRGGTPTDNPIIEAVNGWIKREMYLDFGIHRCDNLSVFLDVFVQYYNSARPAYALNYRNPIQFKIEQGF